MMDPIDEGQQKEIDQLKVAAEHNRQVDRWQWVIILSGIIGVLLYINMALVTLIRDQSATIAFFREKDVLRPNSSKQAPQGSRQTPKIAPTYPKTRLEAPSAISGPSLERYKQLLHQCRESERTCRKDMRRLGVPFGRSLGQ